ncbi:MAG: hypothetical protein E5V63_04185 [Mesorhizobium sp.]|nr:MAG: hypothetical protein E5V63_04185 [Mesorhizobium sp.]
MAKKKHDPTPVIEAYLQLYAAPEFIRAGHFPTPEAFLAHLGQHGFKVVHDGKAGDRKKLWAEIP